MTHKKAKHTPVPWVAFTAKVRFSQPPLRGFEVATLDGDHPARLVAVALREEDARLIAAAVNAHEDLLEALTKLYAAIPDCEGDWITLAQSGAAKAAKAVHAPGIGQACLIARAALAKATKP